ncbi:MAG: hypothetical protein U0984_06455 [Prosthecobacter sp.]|nr:hypothetical protein [Prosthecobacter sp.]
MKSWISILCVSGLLLGTAKLAGQDTLKEEGERVAVLEDKRINESSGIALGLRDPSIFWTLNDSGGEPCIFAVDRQGKTRAKVRIRDAANFDWEDLATGRDAQGNPCVFVGDIGDNFQLRPTVQIYQLDEPVLPPAAEAGKEIESTKPQIWRFSYPDGPRNAESLLVHPITGRLYTISKSEEGHSALYAFPQPLMKDKAMVLEKVIALEFPATVRVGKRPKDACQVTAACFAPDGRRLIIATYSYLHEWQIDDGEPLATALTRPATVIKPVLLAQLEAICYDADRRSLWLTSERLPTPLYRISRKD